MVSGVASKVRLNQPVILTPCCGVGSREYFHAAPGHAVGHTIFTVTSEGKSFVFLGDLSHHAVLLLEKPRMEFAYDTDPKQAAATRVKLLDMLAANKTAVMSYHFAWPGYGHVVKNGDGFRYIPEPMNMTL
jgi:glyoxylase-like metal-dependent hydrolase (beta-lactamase superfamily II)